MGKPEKALELCQEMDRKALDEAVYYEGAIVGAGALADMKRVDDAIALLERLDLRPGVADGASPPGLVRAGGPAREEGPLHPGTRVVRGGRRGRFRGDGCPRTCEEALDAMSAEVRELTSTDDLERAFDVMNELRMHLDVDSYRHSLATMQEGGYRLFAAEDDGEIVALAGIAIRTNFYYGKFLYVYDLVTSETVRSKGHGKLLLDHLEELARADGCETIALSSGVQRADAHRFYEDKMGYDRVSYVFKKEL